MKIKFILILTALLVSLTSSDHISAANEAVVSVKLTAVFDDVRADVESAVLNQSFVIDFNAKVGEMLNRTATDVGIGNPVYLRAETWQFCSAKLSHEMVLADPLNIAFCPYVIFAFETAESPGEVVVGYRRPVTSGSDATTDALNIIDKKLQTILDEISG